MRFRLALALKRVGTSSERPDLADGVREGVGADEAPHGSRGSGRCSGVLASNLSRGVTGNVLFVDAGMHMV